MNPHHHASPGGARVTPMRIARHPLLTPPEKLELLRRLRAEITTAEHFIENGPVAEDIEFAIDAVHEAVAAIGETPASKERH